MGKKHKEKVRLGGMALPNGVLVHGPNAWACAIRNEEGRIEVASAKKRFRATRVNSPFLRGPLRLPAAELPMENPRTVVSMLAAATFVRGLRESKLSPFVRELLSAVVSITPAVLTLRSGELAAYHGAEHISIGTYEHGKRATKEHERCGGHLVGPLLVTSAVGNVLAGLAPERHRKPAQAAAQIGAVGAATELFGWMSRHPEHPLARALSKPGHELQHRFSTAEPSAEQLEVAEAALKACLELEHAEQAG